MTREIDRDLFVRLMQMSAPARKELLEYIGQGPVSAEPLKAALSSHDTGPRCAAGGAAKHRH